MFEYSVKPFDFKFGKKFRANEKFNFLPLPNTLAYLTRQNLIPIHADKNESQIYFKKNKKLIVNEKS